MKLHVTFGARSLAGANDGLDLASSAARYADALRDALAREWPDAHVEVTFTEDRAPVRAEAMDCETEAGARAAERTALDLAWVVKGTAPWARVGGHS